MAILSITSTTELADGEHALPRRWIGKVYSDSDEELYRGIIYSEADYGKMARVYAAADAREASDSLMADIGG